MFMREQNEGPVNHPFSFLFVFPGGTEFQGSFSKNLLLLIIPKLKRNLEEKKNVSKLSKDYEGYILLLTK